MKVAITSSSFATRLEARDLTQLEWLEGCASVLDADGVVFDRSHFPRTDADYLAQLRKVAVDVGLVPLGIDEPRLFDPQVSPAERTIAIDLAAGIGALFVLTVLPPAGAVPPAAFVAAVKAARMAVSAAKEKNITLLVGAASGTLGATTANLKHFAKDVDSAWLRYLLPAGADRSALGARDRALMVRVDPHDTVDDVAEVDEAARPWVLLTGAVDRARVNALRRAAAKKTLAIVSVS